MNHSMSISERVQAFVSLGNSIQNLKDEERETLLRRIENSNNWFTSRSVDEALAGIRILTHEENLNQWVSKYSFSHLEPRKQVGILMAGNIPGVGFHDLMVVLLSGNDAHVKMSSGDAILMNWIIGKLIEAQPVFSDRIVVQEMLKGKQAYIATGSDNSSRYFDYYFGKYPSVIRANRTSVAILEGGESIQELQNLGKDIFLYFGLGCRNVSKVYVKNESQLTQLLNALEVFSWVKDHHKYLNNYEYNKSIYLVNKEHHLDNGFLLLKESKELVSPIGVLYYEFYTDLEELEERLGSIQHKIQCILARDGRGDKIQFGMAQQPKPWDYADQVDTMDFLLSLA